MEIELGEKLRKKLEEIGAKLGTKKKVRIGFLEGATYPDGTPVAMIAAIQDFGAPAAGIPPRPFFRNMVAEKSKDWPEAIAKTLKATDYDVDKTLSMVGEAIAGQLRQSIKDTNEPPLKPATVKAKGSSKPLVDSGVMLASVDYEVK